MSGKKIRGRANRAKRGKAAAQPPLVTPSALHEPPGPHPLTQRDEIEEETIAAPTATLIYMLDGVTRAQLATKLRGFIERSLMGIEHTNQAWVAASKFAGSVGALAIAADRGNEEALLAMMIRSLSNIDIAKVTPTSILSTWVSKARAQDNDESNLWLALKDVDGYLVRPAHDASKDVVMAELRLPADRGSATARHTLGMFMYIAQGEKIVLQKPLSLKGDSGAKASFLDAARWIRKAAMQAVMEAQYELGEMFYCGLFCDHIYTRFARKYIRRASVQGHVEAITRMHELRTCVQCGADDAPRACSLCHQARYCNTACSEMHWCEGGGVGGGVSGNAGARHKDTCPRMYARKSRADKGRSC